MKRFLIYISQSYGVPIGMPLQEEIARRGFGVKWFCDEESVAQGLEGKIDLLRSVSEVMEFHPDVVLTATNLVPDFFPGIKVQIFHGFSVGKRSESKGHFNIRGFFDLYCTQGPSTTRPFEELQKKHRYFKVVETGWSKVDPLFPIEVRKDADALPTVMISSTFTTRLSLAKNPVVIRELERLSKSGKYRFIAVLHPMMEREVVEQFRSMQNDHFTFYDTVDLIPLFREADVMLSDTTSAITEFVLQKKPVVTINNNRPQPYMINITEPEKIEEALEYALERPAEVMEHIEEFVAQTHPYSDSRSSARVIDACLDFLEHEKVRRKPLNLIRRYKIRKKLGYWKIW